MAKFGSPDVAFLLVDGLSILGVQTEINDSREAVLEENTPLGIAAPTWAAVGLKRGSFSQNGYYDDTAGSVNTAFANNSGASRVVMYGYETNALAAPFVGMAGVCQTKYTRQAAKGALHKANAEWQVSGSVDQGVLIAPLAARTTAGDTKSGSVDNGAQTTAGGYGYLELTSLTLGGYTNLVVTINNSTNNSAWSDYTAFAACTAVGAQRLTFAGTMPRYTAITWAWTGAGSGQSATFTVGLVRS